MKRDEAVKLDEMFPTAATVDLRKGSDFFVDEIDGEVETLAVYNPPSGAPKMFGWAGDSLYDVSTPGAVGAALLSTLNNARWQVANVTTSGGNFLEAVNGEDELLLYNGTTWTPINAASTPAITGILTTKLVNISIHKNRVWFVEKDSLNAWYTTAGALAGALTKFPLGGLFREGGYLVAQGTWTVDGGDGPDDYACFVTSMGEVAVYQGTDPTSATTWSLVGIYRIGTPIGRRCLQKLGGDLLVITTDGVVSASRYFVKDRTDKTVATTDLIQTAMSDAVALYGNNDGWELTFYPEGAMLLLNVPVDNGTQQFVMNTVTRKWCRFLKWPASCFAVMNKSLYFGMNGEVRRAWYGTSDCGLPINAELLQAFNYFGNRNQQKLFTLARPILAWNINPARIRLGVDTDFQITTPTGDIRPPPDAEVLVWGTGRWGINLWGGGLKLNKEWYTVGGVGFAGALHMLISTKTATIKYSSCDFVFEPGEVV